MAVAFEHDGKKYTLQFTYNGMETGYVMGSYSGKPLWWRGLTILRVLTAPIEPDEALPPEVQYVCAYCSMNDSWDYRKGAKVALRRWLFTTTRKRTSELHKAAWKAFIDQYKMQFLIGF